MDYAFAPGSTAYDRHMRGLMGRRPTTTVVHNRQTRTVEKFVDHLETDSGVTRPVDDILIASHGNSSGNLQIVLFQGAPSRTTYEVIQQAKLNGKVIIPSTVPTPSSATDPTHLHVKGCKIGQAPVVMQALKEAFGSHLPTLTAPKHFHALYYISSHGYFEFLSYSFSLKSKDRYTNRNTLITALQGANFKYIDGTNVPNTVWPTWVPRNFNNRRTRTRIRVPFGSTLGSLSRLRLNREFRHDVIRFQYQVTGLSSNPSNKLASLTSSINAHALFQSTHPYPMYTRYGFASAADFLSGFNWRYTWRQSAHTLVCTGTRHNYEVALPITDPTSTAGNLICNFYPKAGSSHSSFQNLLETDARLFLTV